MKFKEILFLLANKSALTFLKISCSAYEECLDILLGKKWEIGNLRLLWGE